MSIRGSKRSPDLLLTSGNTSPSFVSLTTSVSSTFRAHEHTLKRLRNSSILRSRFRWNRTSPRTSSDISEFRTLGKTDLLFFNEAKRRFAGDRFEMLFKDWKAGRIAEAELRAEFPSKVPNRKVYFETYLVPK